MTETMKAEDKSTTWLLLRGLGRDQRHWGGFPTNLQQALPTHRVLTPDLPGNGSLVHLTSPTSIAQATDYYRLWLREQTVTGPIHLVGLSMGGMVAIDWLCRYPNDISFAYVINSSMKGCSLPWQRMRLNAMLRLLFSSLISKKQLEHQVRLLTSNMQPNPQALELQWVKWAKDASPSLFNFVRQLWAAASFEVTTLPHTERLLLLASTHDHLVNSSASRRIADKWNLPLIEHPKAGHDLPLDDPQWLVDQLIKRKNNESII
ncbi:alpha/beta fold hydrolase [Marinomonas sp.]|uniref:alpha/beta fold hydrolase n=1 Tax=Marinomonas sp. TaxID=1904862 RepID=UPI003BACE2D6